MDKNEKLFIITDGCMWEKNKKDNTSYPHSIEVVDNETGQVRYIKSGARIALIEGEITDTRSQDIYNKVRSQVKNKLQRGNGKKSSP